MPATTDKPPSLARELATLERMAEWFAAEAERVYQMLGEEDEEAETRDLVDLVARLAERNGGRVTVKRLQNANSRKYRSRADAEAALQDLVALGLGRWEDAPARPGGGHRPKYFVPCPPPDPDAADGDEDAPPPAGPGPSPSPAGGTGQGSEASEGSDGVSRAGGAPPAAAPPGPPTQPYPPTPSDPSDPSDPRPADGRPGGPVGCRPGQGSEASEGSDGVRSSGQLAGGGLDRWGMAKTPSDSSDPSDSWRGERPGDGMVNTVAAAGGPPTPSDSSDASDSRFLLPEGATAAARPPSGGGLAVIATTADLDVVAAAVAASAGPVGLDSETTGLDHARHQVRLLQLATPRGTFLIDVFAFADPAAALAPVFEALAATGVVGHNLGFDLPFLMRLGFTPGRVVDTMLASQVLHAGDLAAKHGLRDVAARHLGLTLDKELQQADWAGTLTPDMLRYAALDAEVPLRAWPELAAELEAAGLTAVAEIEFAALPCVAWAATRGVGLDRAAWQALAADADAERARLREALDATAPDGATLFGARNWDSHDDVKAALAAVGVALEATDDDALAAVAHPLAGLVRDYRSAAQLATTYGRDWLRHVAPDGRVYATWKQIGAGASGRMSCKGPNLQQLPRDARYRRCFVAPAGRALVKADYSQIELRVAAKVAREKRMLEAYRTGEDLHTLTAKALLGKAEVSKADRQLAKAVNFGLLYGQGADGLRRYARAGYGVALTEAEAVRHRETFFRTYPGLRAWHRSVGDGAVDTRTLAGRRRLGVTRYTEKLNTPIQGAGADGLKRALALLWERRGQCPDAFPVLVVHDEVVVECDAGRDEEAAVWLRDAMRDGMAPLVSPVPVEVEVTAGPTWGG